MNDIQILVVEDDAGCRDVLQEILSRNHYPLCVVKTAEEAREQLSQRQYDIIFTDVTGVDGLETLRLSKRQNPDVEVIVFSGDRHNAAPSLNEGAARFIAKPFTVQEVLTIAKEAIERVIKRKS